MSVLHSTEGLPSIPGVEYRYIPGYSDWYCVGSDGSVWSCCRVGRTNKDKRSDQWRPKPPTVARHGYLVVRLRRDGKGVTKTVHSLVATAFHGPCPESQECRHLDGNPANAAASNLAWGTVAENAADRKLHGTDPVGIKHGRHVLDEATVIEIRKRIVAGDSQQDIAAAFDISRTAVEAIRHLRTWSHIPWPECPPVVKNAPRSRRDRRSLTETDVTEIRKQLVAGKDRQRIAWDFGVTTTTVWCILTLRTWAHIPWPDRPIGLGRPPKRTVS